jgi:hypothetical protein
MKLSLSKQLCLWPFEDSIAQAMASLVVIWSVPLFRESDELAQPPFVFAQSKSNSAAEIDVFPQIFSLIVHLLARAERGSQRAKVHLGVDPCCICLPVTQHFTDFLQRCSPAEHLSRQRMAEQVASFPLRNDAGPTQGTGYRLDDCAPDRPVIGARWVTNKRRVEQSGRS